MTAQLFLVFASTAVFAIIVAAVLVEAARRPHRTNLDIALFFGVIAAVLAVRSFTVVTGTSGSPLVRALLYSGVVVLPYLLLRIVDSFAPRPHWLMRVVPALLPLLIGTLVVLAYQTTAPVVHLVAAGWFLVLGGYAAAVLAGESRTARGVTARRLAAAAAGSGLVALILVLAVLLVTLPAAEPLLALVIELLAVATGVAYFAAFAPPPFLRRIWQEPEFRAFLSRSALLATEKDERVMLRELERLAADALGAPAAVIALRAPDGDHLRYQRLDGGELVARTDEFITGHAFSSGRALFTLDAERDDPAKAKVYRTTNVKSVLAAPINAAGRPIGALAIHAPRAPLFARDDLVLTQLLADQVGTVVETRRLLLEAARLDAREEAARVKEDFLSAAAHDLRTPLASLLLQADLLGRQLARDGHASHVVVRAEQVLQHARTASELVTDLLDAAREERAGRRPQLEPVDLAAAAREAAAIRVSPIHTIRVEADREVVGSFDRLRIRQLFDNLLDNAVKYTPGGGEIVVRVTTSGPLARGSVSDPGIGVTPDDLPLLFERFTRGANVDDRRFKGIGLGLYICRRIVTEHGGRIWAESEVGAGTTVGFELPLEATKGTIEAVSAADPAASESAVPAAD